MTEHNRTVRQPVATNDGRAFFASREVERVLDECPLSGAQKLMLVSIASHAGDGGAWPSVATLARYCGVNERAAQRTIRALVDAGWLEVIVNGGGTLQWRGDQRPNLYRILWPAPDGVAKPAPRDGVHKRAPRGAHSRADGVAKPAPEDRQEDHLEERSAKAPPAGAASAQLPLADMPAGNPQAEDSLGDIEDPMALPWRLVRETFDQRARKPIESRKTTARTVRRLLDAGWSGPQVRTALLQSPAWTPTSLQVELARGGARPGRAARARPVVDDDRRDGDSRVVDVAEEIRRARR